VVLIMAPEPMLHRSEGRRQLWLRRTAVVIDQPRRGETS
jgi:hypothetical protein